MFQNFLLVYLYEAKNLYYEQLFGRVRQTATELRVKYTLV